MSDAVIISIGTAVISAITTIVVLLINKKVQNVEKKVDGRMDELLAIVKTSSIAEGNLAGRAEVKAENEVKPDDPLRVEIVKIPDNKSE